jgi:hypothetical protein
MNNILIFNFTVIPTNETNVGQVKTSKILARFKFRLTAGFNSRSALGFTSSPFSTLFSSNLYFAIYNPCAFKIRRHYIFYAKSKKFEMYLLEKNKLLDTAVAKLNTFKYYLPLKISTPNNMVVLFEELEHLAALRFHEKKKDKLLKSYWNPHTITWGSIIKVPYSNKAGIYLIQNKITNKKYIGKSINLAQRIANYANIYYI